MLYKQFSNINSLATFVSIIFDKKKAENNAIDLATDSSNPGP